jgi:hypothetical protein
MLLIVRVQRQTFTAVSELLDTSQVYPARILFHDLGT